MSVNELQCYGNVAGEFCSSYLVNKFFLVVQNTLQCSCTRKLHNEEGYGGRFRLEAARVRTMWG